MNRQQQRDEQRAINGYRELFARSASVLEAPSARGRHHARPAKVPHGEAHVDPAAAPPLDGTQHDGAELDGAAFVLDDSALAAPPRRARAARLLAERRPALLLAAVAVVAAVVASLITWLNRPVGTPVAAAPAASQVVHREGAETGDPPGQAGRETTAAPPQSSGSAAAEAQIVVSVLGKVAQPGLVTLTEGARVLDAITAAGGALPDADLTTVNLARKVVDGEQIVVGVPGAGSADAPVTGPPSTPTKVNLNHAGLAELDSLPGIGPVIAQRILDYREENGPFDAVDDLAGVSGIGPALIADLRDLVTV